MPTVRRRRISGLSMHKLLRLARSATAAGSSEPAVRPRPLACSEEGEAQLLPPPRHGPTARRSGDLRKNEVIKIVAKVIGLLDEPCSYGYKKLSEKTNLHSVRLGEYRIICSINDSAHLIDVVKAGLGKDTYR